MGSMASQITSLTIVYATVYSGADQRKHQSSASLAFVRVIHRGPVNSPHKGPVTRKMFPFDDVIMTILTENKPVVHSIKTSQVNFLGKYIWWSVRNIHVHNALDLELYMNAYFTWTHAESNDIPIIKYDDLPGPIPQHTVYQNMALDSVVQVHISSCGPPRNRLIFRSVG